MATVSGPVTRLGGSRDDTVFLSVFPKPDFTTPTPEATPVVGTTSTYGQPFGGPDSPAQSFDHFVSFARAWSAITRYLSLSPGVGSTSPSLDHGIKSAWAFLVETTSSRKEVQAWFRNETSVHFRTFVQPQLQAWQHPISVDRASETLDETINILRRTYHYYSDRLEAINPTMYDLTVGETSLASVRRMQDNIRLLLLHSLPLARLQMTLTSVMYDRLRTSLSTINNADSCAGHGQCHCTLDLSGLPLQEMRMVGLGGPLGQRAFANAIHRLLQGPLIERQCFAVDWNGRGSVVPSLRSWVQLHLMQTVKEALVMLDEREDLKSSDFDTQQLVSIAVTNLAHLRISTLFDYVKSWPASAGAILDIWEHLSSGGPTEKLHLCHSFSVQIRRRLLHAGASTSEILSVYINMIHVFKSLDSRGVLLEKVALPVRNYLRTREDTVGIIAASFLADVDQQGSIAASDIYKICPDIAIEVANSSLEINRDRRVLGWDDMNWTPDPIDAGPDYHKSEDIISYVLGNLFEQEEFIKEVTNVLAQHLLHPTDSEYIKETRLIELFKSRLDPSKLQAAEVMLKDVRDSVSLGKRINPFTTYGAISTVAPPTPTEIRKAIPEEGITLSALYSIFEKRIKRAQFIAAVKLVANRRNDLFFAKRTRLVQDDEPSLHKKALDDDQADFKVQILSSFFWPQLRSNDFELPSGLTPLQQHFEERFASLGSQRKLRYRPALSRISIRLQLEDRTIEEKDVPGWRASVIDAFASGCEQQQAAPVIEYDNTTGLSIEQLIETLNMDEELVRDAVNFWRGKNVLYELSPGVFAVLERLDMDVGGGQQQQMQDQPAESVSAVVSQDAMLKESAPMFEAFIANMLRNQGPKEIGGMMGITSLLKMVLPSFTYGEDEVAWLLGQLESRGQVARNGEVWSVV